MNSFFEKLKRGMDIDEVQEPQEELARPPEKKPAPKKPEEKKEEPKKITVAELPESFPEPLSAEQPAYDGPEGELAVDIYQNDGFLVIQSAVAGMKQGDLEISMERDVITIKGKRMNPNQEKVDYFAKECFWGKFSRRIITPVEVDQNSIEASIKNGILTIKIPKIQREKIKKVEVKS